MTRPMNPNWPAPNRPPFPRRPVASSEYIRRMELENRRQAAIDALPWQRRVARRWGIVWLPVMVGTLVWLGVSALLVYWVLTHG